MKSQWRAQKTLGIFYAFYRILILFIRMCINIKTTAILIYYWAQDKFVAISTFLHVSASNSGQQCGMNMND